MANPVNFTPQMRRAVISLMLMFNVLLSQAGLPLHMHYCKGMLESFSVFILAGCDDHEEEASMASCCTKPTGTSCQAKAADCCDDEVKVLLQDVDSLQPHFEKWDVAPALATTEKHDFLSPSISDNFSIPSGAFSDTGPPLYIRLHSLIYYA
jgi:hypothetical protein